MCVFKWRNAFLSVGKIQRAPKITYRIVHKTIRGWKERAKDVYSNRKYVTWERNRYELINVYLASVVISLSKKPLLQFMYEYTIYDIIFMT